MRLANNAVQIALRITYIGNLVCHDTHEGQILNDALLEFHALLCGICIVQAKEQLALVPCVGKVVGQQGSFSMPYVETTQHELVLSREH
jgi:hypothetical protein